MKEKDRVACSFCGKQHNPEVICDERKRVMSQPNKVGGFPGDRPHCICGKPVKFYSKRLEHGFCSDRCYEDVQRGTDPSQAHIVVTRKQGAFFEQGDIKFSVDEHDLDKVLGSGRYGGEPSVVEKLMDSQVVALATANGLNVSPFVRHLVTRPLHGIIQYVWYRDLKYKVDFEHLQKNQLTRIADYNRLLVEYKPSEDGTGEKATKRVSKKAVMLSSTFRAVNKAVTVDKGRASDLLLVVKSFKDGATMAQIIEAANGKVKTKQPLQKIVQRFLGVLVADGAVEEVK